MEHGQIHKTVSCSRTKQRNNALRVSGKSLSEVGGALVESECCHLLEVGKFPTSDATGGVHELCHFPAIFSLTYITCDICRLYMGIISNI